MLGRCPTLEDRKHYFNQHQLNFLASSMVMLTTLSWLLFPLHKGKCLVFVEEEEHLCGQLVSLERAIVEPSFGGQQVMTWMSIDQVWHPYTMTDRYIIIWLTKCPIFDTRTRAHTQDPAISSACSSPWLKCCSILSQNSDLYITSAPYPIFHTHVQRTRSLVHLYTEYIQLYLSRSLSPPPPLKYTQMVPDRHNLDHHLHLCNISLINVSVTMIVLMCNISLMDIKPWLSLCLQLCDLSLMDYGSLHFRYSIIAASALYHHTNEHLVADVSGNLV